MKISKGTNNMAVFTVMSDYDGYSNGVFGTFTTEKNALDFVSDMAASDPEMLELEELANDTINDMQWTGLLLTEQKLDIGNDWGYNVAKIYWDKENNVAVRVDQ